MSAFVLSVLFGAFGGERWPLGPMSTMSPALSHTIQRRRLVRRQPHDCPAARDLSEAANRATGVARQMRLVSQRGLDHDVRALQGGAVQDVSHVALHRGEARDRQAAGQDRERVGQVPGEGGRVDKQARDELGEVQRDQTDDSEESVRHNTEDQGRGDQVDRRCRGF